MTTKLITFAAVIAFIATITTTSHAQSTWTLRIDSTTFIFEQTCFVINWFQDATSLKDKMITKKMLLLK